MLLPQNVSTVNIRYLKTFTQVVLIGLMLTFAKVIFQHDILYSNTTFQHFFFLYNTANQRVSSIKLNNVR